MNESDAMTLLQPYVYSYGNDKVYYRDMVNWVLQLGFVLEDMSQKELVDMFKRWVRQED